MNLVTWNMQAAGDRSAHRWETGVRGLFQSGAEVVCLQECGPPPADSLPAAPPPWLDHPPADAGIDSRFLLWNVGAPPRPLYVVILWIQADGPGRAVNLAVATLFAPVSPEGTRAPSHLLLVPNPHEFGRPAVGLRLPYNGASLDIYSIHALAPGGHDAPALLERLRASGAPWFGAGDFGHHRAEWPGKPLDVALCPHNGDIVQPGRAHRSTHAFIHPAPAVHGFLYHGLLGSDYSPVAYRL